MKSVYFCLVVLCAMIALPGCPSNSDNTVITDGLTQDDFAKYEADLAAVSSEEAYADEDIDEE